MYRPMLSPEILSRKDFANSPYGCWPRVEQMEQSVNPSQNRIGKQKAPVRLTPLSADGGRSSLSTIFIAPNKLFICVDASYTAFCLHARGVDKQWECDFRRPGGVSEPRGTLAPPGPLLW